MSHSDESVFDRGEVKVDLRSGGAEPDTLSVELCREEWQREADDPEGIRRLMRRASRLAEDLDAVRGFLRERAAAQRAADWATAEGEAR